MSSQIEMMIRGMKELAHRVSHTRTNDDEPEWPDNEEHPGVAHIPAKAKMGPTYGTLERSAGPSGASVVNAYQILQTVLVVFMGLWVVYSVGHRLVGGGSFAAAPSPAAPMGLPVAPSCEKYTYPQCERSLHTYITQGARDRCEAFERVKAEGDVIRSPHLPILQQDICEKAGCCGCPGQCSNCPPVLPECGTFQLDGSWDVAFEDGQNAVYHFDARGHVEVDMTAGALPASYVIKKNAYIAAGDDILGSPLWLTVANAEKKCGEKPDCRGFTYNSSSRTDENKFFIWLKKVPDYQKDPNSPWQTYIIERHPGLAGHAAIAGSFSLHKWASLHNKSSFFFSIHNAAPALFPKESADFISKTSTGALHILRYLPGQKVLKGTGIELRSPRNPQ